MLTQEMAIEEPTLKAKQYWDSIWLDRIKPDGVNMNHEKLCKLIYELAMRQHYGDKEKLDIGCGSAVHALILSLYHRGWKDKWTGIDISEKAVNYAKTFKLNVVLSSFEQYETDKKYEVFLLLDTFEHLTATDKLADKILELADTSFTVFGNIPLFTGQKAYIEGNERIVSINDISYFMKLLGIKEFYHEIWGAYGHPFLIFEGSGVK